MRGTIGNTPWVVQDDGSLEATYGDGDGAIHAMAIGSAPGSRDGIAVRAVRWDRVLMDSTFDDMATAMEEVARVVQDEWDEDDRLAEEMRWVAVADAAEDERQAAAAALGEGEGIPHVR